MAYRKVDNCGPVPYPDQSGRFLGEGEVVENDDANDWSPLVALGFVAETGAVATPDTQESPEELKQAVKLPPPPKKTVSDMAKIAAASSTDEKPATVADSARSAAKKKKKKNGKKKKVSDGSDTSNDGAGAEEVDTSKARRSDS
jgi:hypothetical protein